MLLFASTSPGEALGGGFCILGPLVTLFFLVLFLISKFFEDRKIKEHAPDLLKLRDLMQPAYQKLRRINSALGAWPAPTATYNSANLQLKEGEAAVKENRFEDARQRARKGLELMVTLTRELSAF